MITQLEEPDGRLFIRNLPYSCTESDLMKFFSKYCEITELKLPLDDKQQCKGYAFLTYTLPESSIKAINDLDGKVFQVLIIIIYYF